MSETVVVQALSLGHCIDVAVTGVGVVHSVFAHAVNLQMGGALWSLLAAEKGDLPFGVRIARGNFDKLGLRRGDSVNVRAGFIGVGALYVIDCRAAQRWLPSCNAKLAPGLRRRLEAVETAALKRSWHESAEMAQAVSSALNEPSRLAPVLVKVIGRGAGATPSGDDVLVGILAVLTSPHSGSAGAKCAGALRQALDPLLAATTDVSGHLLRQAAGGFVGRDVHELLSALIGNTSPDQMQAIVRRVIETGAMSGADTCMGILAVAPSFLIPQYERFAA